MEKEEEEEVARKEVSFTIESFWKVLEKCVFEPHDVFTRIYFSNVDPVTMEEQKRHEECKVKTLTRIVHSSLPDKERPIRDKVIFDYHKNQVTFIPFVPQNHQHLILEQQLIIDKYFFSEGYKNRVTKPLFDSAANNPETYTPDKYLPYFYPNVKQFSYQLIPLNSSTSDTTSTTCTTTNNTVKYYFIIKCKYWSLSHRIDFEKHMRNISTCNLTLLTKWATNEDNGGYQKRFIHDALIPVQIYYEKYNELKQKYKFWVEIWPETTDPAKFVYEELGIAAFLICLWTLESQTSLTPKLKKPNFIDVGCGNGFLVYLLANEGYQGKGIDISERKIWKEYSKHDQLGKEVYTLETFTITSPLDTKFNEEEYEWVIGNHSDELTPWIPWIAGNSTQQKFFVLPCCMFDFVGRFMKGVDLKLGRYNSYLNYVEMIGKKCGFEVRREILRIPSTKCVGFVGTKKRELSQEEEEEKRELVKDFNKSLWMPRESDHTIQANQQKKKQEKREKKRQKQEKQKKGVVGEEQVVQ